MKILVTGASGFIGRAYIRRALERGHEVGALVRGEGSDLLTPAIPGRLTLLRGSLQEPPWREIARFKPEVCLHAAWIATPGVYLESPDNQTCYDASRVFLGRLAQTGLGGIVGIGTCIEYQIDGQVLNEADTPVRPQTPYARYKDLLRQDLERASATTGCRLAWARIFYPFGPGEHKDRLCSATLAKLRRGEPVVLNTPGSIKDYIYIDDVAAALLAVSEQRHAGAINVCTGRGTTVRTMVELIARRLGRLELVRVPDRPETADPLGFVVGDPARLRALGWQPETSVATGIEKLVDMDKLKV